jgi:hypothetical protein
VTGVAERPLERRTANKPSKDGAEPMPIATTTKLISSGARLAFGG